MNTNGTETSAIRTRRSAATVINQALLAEGMTLDEIEQDRRLADLFDYLLACGRTVDEINADWENKTADEILCADTGLLAARPEHAV